MPKKVKTRPGTKSVNVRNMPVDLWVRFTKYLERTRQLQYAVMERALREFLEREDPK
jgi:hypothetical protein